MKGTYSEILVKMRHGDVILRHVTLFSYIFPYRDVIDKNFPTVSKNVADISIFPMTSAKIIKNQGFHAKAGWQKIGKMTSRDVMWHHHVGFWPKRQEMFLFSYLSYGPKMKFLALTKQKLWMSIWAFSRLISTNVGRYIGNSTYTHKTLMTWLLDMRWT